MRYLELANQNTIEVIRLKDRIIGSNPKVFLKTHKIHGMPYQTIEVKILVSQKGASTKPSQKEEKKDDPLYKKPLSPVSQPVIHKPVREPRPVLPQFPKHTEVPRPNIAHTFRPIAPDVNAAVNPPVVAGRGLPSPPIIRPPAPVPVPPFNAGFVPARQFRPPPIRNQFAPPPQEQAEMQPPVPPALDLPPQVPQANVPKVPPSLAKGKLMEQANFGILPFKPDV